MSRRALAAGSGGGLLAALLLAPATGTALGELARARAARAAAAAPMSAPPALVAPGLRVAAASEAEARRVLANRIRTLSASSGVLTEQVAPLRGGAGLVRLRVRLSGPQKAVVALIERLEREAPLMRLRGWEVRALADGGLRVDGEAVGAWR